MPTLMLMPKLSCAWTGIVSAGKINARSRKQKERMRSMGMF